jgi:hypothetical protein
MAKTSGVDLPDIASRKFFAATLDKLASLESNIWVICPTGKSVVIE